MKFFEETLWTEAIEYNAFSNRTVDIYCGGLPIFQSINYTSVDHIVRIPFAPVASRPEKIHWHQSNRSYKVSNVSHSSSLSDTRMQDNTWDTIGEERDRWLQHRGVPIGVWGRLWMCRQQLWNVYEGPTNLSHSYTTKSGHACRLYHTCRYKSRPPSAVTIDIQSNKTIVHLWTRKRNSEKET